LEGNGETIYLTAEFLPICATVFPDKLLKVLSIAIAASIFLSFLQ